MLLLILRAAGPSNGAVFVRDDVGIAADGQRQAAALAGVRVL